MAKEAVVKKKDHHPIRSAVLFAVLLLFGITMIIPFVWMLSSSFKYNNEIFLYPIRWIPQPIRFSNYVEVWTEIPFLRYYVNTLVYSLIVTLGQLFTCSLAAYSFAKLHYPGRDKLFLAYLATLMVPWHAIMIPQFIVNKTLGLYNSPWALICMTVFTFNFMWNDYMAPMFYLDDDKIKKIQLGLAAFRTLYKTEYGLIMAGTVCSLIPMIALYVCAQKYLIEGIAFSGLKG